MKFSSVFRNELASEDNTLREIRVFARKLYRLCNVVRDRAPMVDAARGFGSLSLEAIDSIRHMLEAGHLSTACVGLRWYLESCHRLFTLYEDSEAFSSWDSGDKLNPHEIGKFLESKGLLSMKEIYFTWSNVVHTNRSFVRSQDFIAFDSPESLLQRLVLRHSLVSLLQTAHKTNSTIVRVVAPFLLKDAIEVRKEFNRLHDLVIEHIDEQVAGERQIMQSYGHSS